METNEAASGLTLLRKPFPPNQISYLPKGGIKLAYVGHAALTDRLLDADPSWVWEPLSFGPEGLPALDGYGGLWIKLTVCGVTRYGYGHAGTKEGGDAIKELIGDALRNAAMRFGAALDLWHKGDLHADEKDDSLVPVLEASIEHVRQQKTGARHAAAQEAAKMLEPTVRGALSKLAIRAAEAFKTSAAAAFDLIEDQGLTEDERTFLWGEMDDSKLRSALKEERNIRAMKGVPA